MRGWWLHEFYSLYSLSSNVRTLQTVCEGREVRACGWGLGVSGG